MDWLSNVDTLLKVFLGIVGSLAAIWVYWTKVRVKYKAVKKKLNSALDAITGSAAIVDPETNLTLKPETLPIGARVAVVEQWQAKAVVTLERIADTLDKMTTIENALTEIANHQQQHEAWSEKWVKEHEAETCKDHGEIWKAIGLSKEP